MDVNDARARLIRLQAERFAALEIGIENPSPYVTRLEDAIAHAHRAYVTSVILEIALLRDPPAGTIRG